MGRPVAVTPRGSSSSPLDRQDYSHSLTVGGSSPGFTVSGERADTFNNSYSDGTAISGSLTEAVSTPVVVTAVLQSNGSYLVSDTGTIQVAYQATITQANGKSSAISDAATITLNGQETVHVDMGGIHISVDMTTGKTE